MDKYEFNIKIEQIKKLNNKKDYITAMKIADTIEWKKVKNARLLSFISQIYQYNKEYGAAKEILLFAYDRAPSSKRILYKLIELMIKEGSLEEAELYLEEFREFAGSDPKQYILQYLLYKAKEVPIELLIPLLENYKKFDFDEKWSYELALLYHEAGRIRDCVSLCDNISLWFGVGMYVEKALELKLKHEPLTQDQQALLDNKSVYEERLKAVEKEFQDIELRKGAAKKHQEQHTKLRGAGVKKEEILKEADTSIVEMDIEELLVLDQDKLAKEIAKMTAEETEENSEIILETTVAEIPEEIQEEIQEEILEESEEKDEYKAKEKPAKELEEEPKEAIEPKEEIELQPHGFSEDKKELKRKVYHILVRSNFEEEGLKLSIGALKKMHKDTGTPVNKIAKISGEKLNERGVENSMEMLAGKDLIIDHAGQLNVEQIDELSREIAKPDCPFVVVLIDTAPGIRKLLERYPDLAVHFSVVVGDSEQLEVKEFVNYARNYATELDCVLDEVAVLAIYALAEERLADNLSMTEAEAEAIIEEAAQMAEKKTIKKMLAGVFSSRYDKDGLLILKEEHFNS